MARQIEDPLGTIAGGFTLAQLPVMLALIAYFHDPMFAMYTTNLRNATSREMDVDVEDFSASVLSLSLESVEARSSSLLVRSAAWSSSTFTCACNSARRVPLAAICASRSA